MAVCYPTEDGMNVEAGTQTLDRTQGAIARTLGIGKNKFVNCLQLHNVFHYQILMLENARSLQNGVRTLLDITVLGS